MSKRYEYYRMFRHFEGFPTVGKQPLHLTGIRSFYRRRRGNRARPPSYQPTRQACVPSRAAGFRVWLNGVSATPELEFTSLNNINAVDRATVDAGRVRVGAAWKLPNVPASVKDAGRVKLGAAWRLPPLA